ncbi:dual specificity protein phosphatase family protein [Rhodobacter ferrooxidans]|uniref:Protein tyrosine/serine phosphatase n=1 Tax=Rhodobacter ferrooxidans TaxID=371731 RepID=C8S442_9RHOB|nr:dual specificity protein phosphatase family protein [Rhodobacter sp. SW2]EEW24208.1 protein tyrosine/serine phosphatase [Rhodobacter sp. SW2]
MKQVVRFGLRLFGLLMLGVLALIAYLLVLYSYNNFHTVIEGELYRSAQVTPEQIAQYQADHGIASILNLRGAAPGKPWYDAEMAASEKLGITHVDFRMSARKALTADQAKALIALMRDMPKPILIHCLQGADRTGLASALYLASIAGRSEDEAAGQISIRYGHFSVPKLSEAYPMDETWQMMLPQISFAAP